MDVVHQTGSYRPAATNKMHEWKIYEPQFYKWYLLELTVLDKCQYIASFWMLFSIWERPCVQKEMIKPNSKYVHITGYSWIKYQEKIYSLGDHSGNGKVTILRRQKKLLKFWEDGHGQYILTETIVESLMSIQWRVLKYWADILYVPSMKIS